MRLWQVTLLNRGQELVAEVRATSKQGARNEAHKLYPQGHIVHVEKSDVGQRSE